MSNAKINTEETVLRVPTDTPANADSNSVRVYTDGTYVYSKDSSGSVVNLSTGGTSLTSDTIVIGNDTGAGNNLIHLKAAGTGGDSIIVGSGSSGSPATESVLIHASTDLDLESASSLKIEALTINIGADSSASSAHTINIGANTAHGDVINIGGQGDGNDVINIGASGGSGLDTVRINGENLIILDLPTSDPLTIGALWNDSGTLKISSGI